MLHRGNMLNSASLKIAENCSMLQLETRSILHSDSLMSAASWKHAQFCILKTCSMLPCCNLETSSILHSESLMGDASWKHAQCCNLETYSILHSESLMSAASWKNAEFCILETWLILQPGNTSIFCILKAS